MKTMLAAAAFALTFASAATAADAKGNYTVIGLGANTCGEYMSAPAEVAAIVGVWVQGYMTALNQAVPDVVDVSGGRTDTQLTDGLYQVCTGKPGMLLADATRELSLQMIGRVDGKKAAKKAEAPAEAAPALRR